MKSTYLILLFLISLFNLQAQENEISNSFVGLKEFILVDSSRTDPYYGGLRVIHVRVYYPAKRIENESKEVGYYMMIEEAFDSLENWTKGNLDLVNGISTGVYYDLEIKNGRFPLILFSPALGSNVSLYHHYFKELASNDLIVIAINHLYESEYVIMPDSSCILADLTFHDQLKSRKINKSFSGDDYRKIKMERQAVLAEDMSFALEMVENKDFFRGHIMEDNLAVFGHSFGAAAAIYQAYYSDNIRAVADLDGTPPSIAFENGIDSGRPDVHTWWMHGQHQVAQMLENGRECHGNG